jgi:hypothetical protein
MRRMTRHAGPILVLLAVLGMVGVRWAGARRAETIVAGEERARVSVLALVQAARSALQRDARLPRLQDGLAAAVPGLSPLPGLGSAEISYASDGVYVYGLATQTHHDAESGAPRPGFVLRAWPLRFGISGDLEYHAGDDGVLWEGQNRTGRSGTSQGFPPVFPEPDVGADGAPWWPAGAPRHR